MAVRVGINGFGRIGRLFFRAAMGNPAIEVVHVNDLFTPQALAPLLKYDSVHGRYPGTVEAGADCLIVDGKTVTLSAEKDPTKLPWGAKNIGYVVESTGLFTEKEKAMAHITAGAKWVIISAPAKNEDITIVIGVNDEKLDPAKHKVISNASCTTNCLGPVAKVILEQFGIVRGLMTTIHAYTNDQNIQDLPHKKDPRRARAAAVSMIPTTTGAAKAIGLVIPELKGKLDGYAMRVPTPNVSVVDVVFQVEKATTKDEVNAALKAAANGPLKGIMDYTEDPVVSIDFNHSSVSSTVDGPLTNVIDGTMVKIVAWYDNEWGYSNRCVDLIVKMAKMSGGCGCGCKG
ncbi:MAG: type I glyceraldehyde-3-phosphate dehydrogenase [Candidatus Sumerlaeota bacterium]|nr:type I glyceraldehyde-3-phosphate dehydrogenase [Candidatus Sumerlaeota bacterium]